MTDDLPSQSHYSGGQQCPECGDTAGLAHSFCRFCGTPLDTPSVEPLQPDAVFVGDTVYVVAETSTEKYVMPATHPDRFSWEVTGRIYGDQQIRLCDRRDELRLEWDQRQLRWNIRGSLRNAHLYPDDQDACSPAEWPPVDLTLQDVERLIGGGES